MFSTAPTTTVIYTITYTFALHVPLTIYLRDKYGNVIPKVNIDHLQPLKEFEERIPSNVLKCEIEQGTPLPPIAGSQLSHLKQISIKKVSSMDASNFHSVSERPQLEGISHQTDSSLPLNKATSTLQIHLQQPSKVLNNKSGHIKPQNSEKSTYPSNNKTNDLSQEGSQKRPTPSNNTSNDLRQGSSQKQSTGFIEVPSSISKEAIMRYQCKFMTILTVFDCFIVILLRILSTAKASSCEPSPYSHRTQSRSYSEG